MSETSNLPAPGWYADPQVPGNLRYWDGSAWTDRSRGGANAPSPLGRSFDRLATLVRVGLVVSLLTLVAQVALRCWGLSMFGDAIAAGDVDRLSSYDNLNLVLVLVEGVTYLVTGVCWVFWQHAVAKSLPSGDLERSPGMHAGSWFIPFGNFVLPFQNMRSLWRTLVSPQSAIIAWWWACLLIANVAFRTGGPGVHGGGLAGLQASVSWKLASSVLGLVAAVLALRIVRDISAAARARASTLSPAASPAA